MAVMLLRNALVTPAALALLTLTAACGPAFMAMGGRGALGGGSGGPSHPPTTEAQWSTAEAAAAGAALGAGAERVDPPIRVAETGAFAARHVPVEGGRCYRVGIAWAFDEALSNSVNFGPGTNLSLRGESHRIEAPSGVVSFCADKAGTVDLTFSAVPRAGFLSTGELLEYAVVVGSSKESDPARAARRKLEAGQAQNAREVAVEQEAAEKAHDADRHQRMCHDCLESYRRCHSGSCRHDFDFCAHDRSYVDLAQHPDTLPCGSP